MAFWRTKQRGPPEMVRALKDSIGKLDAAGPGTDTVRKVSVLFTIYSPCLCVLIMSRYSYSPGWAPSTTDCPSSCDFHHHGLTPLLAVFARSS